MDTGEPELGTLKGLAEAAISLHKLIGKPTSNLSEFGGIVSQSGILPNAPIALIQEESRQIHSAICWVEAGLPTFDLTHGLMSALLLTDPSNIDSSDVRLPFSTFVVRLPDGFWELHQTEGKGATTASLAIVHTYMAVTSKSQDSRDLRSMLSFQIMGRKGTTSTWEARYIFPESGPIGGWLEEDTAPIKDPSGTVVPPDDLDHRHAIAFRRLLVNLCLYVTAHGRGERVGRRKPGGGKVERRPAQPTPDVWLLGREVKLDRDLVNSAKAWSEARDGQAKTRAAWELQARFTVRGHWRNQAHGTGWSERKLKWIAPYWKGEGPSFAHVYKVTE